MKSSILACIVATCLVQFTFAYLEKKPDFIKTCQIYNVSEPEFVQCSTESIQALFENIYKGVPGLEDIKVDPLRINRIRVLTGSGPVSVNASLSKVLITGFRNTKVLRSYVDKADFSWVTNLNLPKIRIEGIYVMKGRILILPLNGRGKCWLEPTNMTITMRTKTRLVEHDNLIFYNITGVKVDYDLTGLRLRFDNLFDGVPALEESTNQYLNENWRPVNDGLKGVIANTIEDILVRIMRKIFDQVPASYLIKDIPKPDEFYKV